MVRFLPVAGLLVACGTGGDTPTWHDDVAPIVYENCAGCHQADLIGPFPLTTYEEATPWGPAMAAEIEAGRMPPFGADTSGECGSFQDERGLSPEEIATIRAWVNADMPEGRPPREELQLPPAETIANPDLTVDFGFDYTPTESSGHPEDDYRCFLLDTGLDTDQYITAFEVEPGDPEMVHHVILWNLGSEEAQTQAESRAGTEGSYTCFGDSGISDSTPMATWAPGSGVVEYPEGTGVEVKAGRKLIMQVHYHLLPESRSDRTKVHLELSSSVAQPAITYLLPASVNLQPGQQAAHAGFDYSLGQVGVPFGVNLWGVLPHMHTRGSRITLRKESADRTEGECLVDVPHWDFQWQQQYFFTEPVRIESDDRIILDCWFDTTGDDSIVRWGDGTNDEMCLVGVYVTL
ncbi:MAG: hypothetical protein EP330_21025 [Deltaproteobacteria bacterium]|nr:MAG: hypothetical protein EP330_21025 [Deltaproteobacteria bacterium]